MMSALVASSLVLAGGDIAPVEPVVEAPVVVESAWQNEVTIYGWLSGVSADTRLPGGSGYTTMDVGDIIDDLKMVFMGSYAARYDKWSLIADLTYVDLGNSANKILTFPDGSSVGTSVDVDMKSWVVNAGVGYNIVNSDKNILDIVAGLRYLDLEVDVNTNLPGTGLSGSKSFTDGIIGVRGIYNIDENWYLPYYADIGTGDTDLTYQLFAGVGYRYDWGDVKLGYRYIGYEMDDNTIVENLDLSGAVLGVSFKF